VGQASGSLISLKDGLQNREIKGNGNLSPKQHKGEGGGVFRIKVIARGED